MRKIFRVAAAALLLLSGVMVLAFAMRSSTHGPAAKDFISYWSAGQLLRSGANPYGQADVFRVERQAGYALDYPLMMRNPPWALFLVVPLGMVSAYTGVLLWSIGIVGTVAFSIHILRKPSRDNLLIYAFVPLLACIMAGQSSAFMLPGFAIFLRLHQRKPFVAGLALLLMAIKPHLFVIFWLILCFDAVLKRRFQVLGGLAAALAVFTGLALWRDPHVFTQYLGMLHTSPIGSEVLPTPSHFLGLLIDEREKWIQMIPTCVATVWAFWYYRRVPWNWETHGPLLVLVCLLVSPYTWMTDQIVLIPAVFLAFYAENRSKQTVPIFLTINAVAVALMLFGFSPFSAIYLWTTTAWLLWYLHARRNSPLPVPVSVLA